MARRYLVQNKKKPLIVICSEGGKKSSEYYYFRNFANKDLRIQFSTGNSTDPKGMLEDLKKYIVNEGIVYEENCRIFLVIDTDLSESRINGIRAIRSECEKYNIEIITSAPTFEIWYLMHYRTNRLVFSSSQNVKKELSKIIDKYTESMNVYSLIKDDTDLAFNTAKKIDDQNIHNDIIQTNPHSDIYKILNAMNKFMNNK